jgi:hypothetical protein
MESNKFYFILFQKARSAHIQYEEEGDGEEGEKNFAQEKEESSNGELFNDPLFINILSKLI